MPLPDQLSLSRTYSFTDHEATTPTQPLSGTRVDIELDRQYSALKDFLTALQSIFTQAGTLQQGVIQEQNLTPALAEEMRESLRNQALDLLDQVAASRRTAQTIVQTIQAISDETEYDRQRAETVLSKTAQDLALSNAYRLNTQEIRAEIIALAAEIETQTASASATSEQSQISEDLAYRWAEYLAGPVVQLDPGHQYPETPDDGLFSAKYWALQAKQFAEGGVRLVFHQSDPTADAEPTVYDGWNEWQSRTSPAEVLSNDLVFWSWNSLTYIYTGTTSRINAGATIAGDFDLLGNSVEFANQSQMDGDEAGVAIDPLIGNQNYLRKLTGGGSQTIGNEVVFAQDAKFTNGADFDGQTITALSATMGGTDSNEFVLTHTIMDAGGY